VLKEVKITVGANINNNNAKRLGRSSFILRPCGVNAPRKVIKQVMKIPNTRVRIANP